MSIYKKVHYKHKNEPRKFVILLNTLVLCLIRLLLIMERQCIRDDVFSLVDKPITYAAERHRMQNDESV